MLRRRCTVLSVETSWASDSDTIHVVEGKMSIDLLVMKLELGPDITVDASTSLQHARRADKGPKTAIEGIDVVDKR